MEVPNEGQSFYHHFQGMFLQDRNQQLLHCTGPHQQWIRDNWASVGAGGTGPEGTQRLQDIDVRIYRNWCSANGDGNTLAVMVDNDPRQAGETAFEDFFVQLVLDQADLCVHPRFLLPTAERDASTAKIVDLFDDYLRHRGKDDKWRQGGRGYFTERVRHFTRQHVPIEFCLPAFPCKSSNLDKVTGPDPDRAEELALEHLHGFVEAVQNVYEPGARLWVVSDGHVFSDCIGVHDADVDAYGAKLREMNHGIGLRRGAPDRVAFKSLVDLFQLAAVDADKGLLGLAARLKVPTIDHHIDTQVTTEADLCRRILMAGCSPRKSAVRAMIDSQDAAVTALYRGFSRFMLEDLEHLPHAQRMTKSQQKKLSAKVAFEMILRNQAYSNLVEILFPNHIRLSIHAHNNSGPKFGIQLFNPTRVRAVASLSANGELMASPDLLHIPTPWHNCVVQLADSDMILVAKAKLARAALVTGCMTGGLVPTETGRAFFQLTRRVDNLDVKGLEQSTPKPEPEPEPKREPEEGDENRKMTVTVTVTVSEKETPHRGDTLSGKADAVVTAVAWPTNPGGLSAAPPELLSQDAGLARLRGIMLLFWTRGR